jgi:hypothetical protein
MDPVTLIVTALAAGAALGLKDTASSAIKEAYGALKALVKKRLAGRPDGEMVLEAHEQAPTKWQTTLETELTAAGARSDAELLVAAEVLMSLADAAGYRAGKYSVDVRGSQGVQVGDHNKQHNVFGARPPRPPAEGRPG